MTVLSLSLSTCYLADWPSGILFILQNLRVIILGFSSSLMFVFEVQVAIIIKTTRVSPAITLAPVGEMSMETHHKQQDPPR